MKHKRKYEERKSDLICRMKSRWMRTAKKADVKQKRERERNFKVSFGQQKRIGELKETAACGGAPVSFGCVKGKIKLK